MERVVGVKSLFLGNMYVPVRVHMLAHSDIVEGTQINHTQNSYCYVNHDEKVN